MRWNTDPAEFPRRLLPAAQGAHRAEFAHAVGNARLHALAGASPLETGGVIRGPCSQSSRCSTAMRASSLRRNAPAKPTSSSARSRRPGRSSPIGARISRSRAILGDPGEPGKGLGDRGDHLVRDRRVASVTAPACRAQAPCP
jgi:hypothetical protein